MTTTRLRDAMVDRLGGHEDLAVEVIGSFLDLLWDEDLHIEEIMSLDVAITIDSRSSGRRIVVQDIRGQLRYWLTTDRDPYALSTTALTELGVVADIDRLHGLCIEFVMRGVPIAELAAVRDVLRGLASD